MTHENPLVSVVIPTYNRAYCLPAAVDSVLNQTHSRTEILVIDDGSTDNSSEIISAKYAGEKRLKYVYQRNRGVCAARNHGIRLAQGDFVAFVDSDDVWKPWKLRMELSGLRAFPDAGMIWTDMEAVNGDGIVVRPKYLREMYTSYHWFTTDDLFSESVSLSMVAPEIGEAASGVKLYYGEIFSQMIMGNLVHTSTVLLTRDRLDKVGGFNENLRYSGEDYDFHLRTCREGPVAFADVPSIQYRIGLADQLTRPEYRIHMATNFLKTVLPVIAQDRERICLPDNMINSVLSYAYGWAGEEYLDNGEWKQGRIHLRRSLRYQIRQPRVISLYVISLLPCSAGQTVRRMLSLAKKKIRRSIDDLTREA